MPTPWDAVYEVFSMSKEYPTLEENIQFIIKDLGAEKILTFEKGS